MPAHLQRLAVVLPMAFALTGCGASATIPEPPADAKAAPMPGASEDLTKVTKDAKKK